MRDSNPMPMQADEEDRGLFYGAGDKAADALGRIGSQISRTGR
jgi:hypothetical protein